MSRTKWWRIYHGKIYIGVLTKKMRSPGRSYTGYAASAGIREDREINGVRTPPPVITVYGGLTDRKKSGRIIIARALAPLNDIKFNNNLRRHRERHYLHDTLCR